MAISVCLCGMRLELAVWVITNARKKEYSRFYHMTWLGTARILYHGILQCRSPSVVMCILLLLVTSTMVSWQHQHQTMDMIMSERYLWYHNGLECCDIMNMPWYDVMSPKYYEWVIVYTSLYMWCDYTTKKCTWLQMTISPFYSLK